MSGARSIGRAALVVSGGILLSRLLGFLRTVVLFGVLGVSVDKDLYDAAFTIPDYLFFLMAGGYLSITLVPILVRYHADKTPFEVRAAFTAVFQAVGAGLVVLTLIMMLMADPLVAMLFPRVVDQARLAELTRIALASQVFFGLGALLMAAQYARRQFVIPTLAPIVYNLGIIVGGLVGALVDVSGPEPFLWGGLAGAAVGNFGLQLWGASRAGIRLVPHARLRHRVLAEYIAIALPLMIGQTVVGLDESWPRLFGQLAGEGSIAALTGARQLNMLPVGIIAQAAGVAAYPFLASLAETGKLDELRATVGRSVRMAVVVSGAAAAVVLALAYPVVEVAFVRGAFDSTDAAAVASLLVVYGLSIPLWSAHQVYTRAFYAQRRMWTPALTGTAVTLVTIPILFGLVRLAGTVGVALGSTIGIALYTVAIGAVWYRGHGSEGRPILTTGVLVALAAAIGGMGALLVAGWLEPSGALIQLLAGTPVGLVLYLAAGRFLGLAEVGELMGRWRRRTGDAAR